MPSISNWADNADNHLCILLKFVWQKSMTNINKVTKLCGLNCNQKLDVPATTYWSHHISFLLEQTTFYQEMQKKS